MSNFNDLVNSGMGNAAMRLGAEQLGGVVGGVSENLAQSVNVGQLKYYFTVDTAYVLKKLKLLLFPFNVSEFMVREEAGKRATPKEDVFAFDLYIPVMAFITFVLVAGVGLGLDSKFSPELLGLTASSLLGWLVVEVLCYYAAFYVLNLQSNAGIWELLSLSSYKYVGFVDLAQLLPYCLVFFLRTLLLMLDLFLTE
eukprot:m.174609 g.174609  ORF g.174609 m.174609 type:complete len:197 (-) comp53308_c0_seq7:94-684(-)